MALVPSQPLAIAPIAPHSNVEITSLSTGRKSGLKAPTMLLTGPTAEVLTCEFSPDGRMIAAAGGDKRIYVYEVYGECTNIGLLSGHKGAILELHWAADGSQLYTASADKSLAIWDMTTGERTKKLCGHHALVTSCSVSRRGPSLLASGGDDGTTRIWDLRCRRVVKSYEHPYQVLSVVFDDSSERVFCGTLDHRIEVYDLRKEMPQDSFIGHTDSVTGLSVSNDGHQLLSNSMDQSIKLWDIRPFFSGDNRCLSTLHGPTHNFEKTLLRVRWDRKLDRHFAAGSADRCAYVWAKDGANNMSLAYKLPGHAGTVNEVCFHPNEPVIASCSTDKTLYLGELE